MNLSILFQEWAVRSQQLFPDATALVSIKKLADQELEELRSAVACVPPGHSPPAYLRRELLDEYADCFMCLVHSMAKVNLHVSELALAFEQKAARNYQRTWKKNDDGTYSHV